MRFVERSTLFDTDGYIKRYVIAIFALFSYALPTATPAANNLPVAVIGDSIAAACCLPVKADRFGFLVASQEGTIANDFGLNGYSVNTTHVKEVGTPLAPVLMPNYQARPMRCSTRCRPFGGGRSTLSGGSGSHV